MARWLQFTISTVAIVLIERPVRGSLLRDPLLPPNTGLQPGHLSRRLWTCNEWCLPVVCMPWYFFVSHCNTRADVARPPPTPRPDWPRLFFPFSWPRTKVTRAQGSVYPSFLFIHRPRSTSSYPLALEKCTVLDGAKEEKTKRL